MPSYIPIDRDQLLQTLYAGDPINDDASRGYALVNVLSPDEFQQEHIPGSINIPQERIQEFERRFSKDKKIVVYCASRKCSASEDVASLLGEQGFSSIYDYEGGLEDWKQAGKPLERSA